jgi:hypothetical protein
MWKGNQEKEGIPNKGNLAITAAAVQSNESKQKQVSLV